MRRSRKRFYIYFYAFAGALMLTTYFRGAEVRRQFEEVELPSRFLENGSKRASNYIHALQSQDWKGLWSLFSEKAKKRFAAASNKAASQTRFEGKYASAIKNRLATRLKGYYFLQRNSVPDPSLATMEVHFINDGGDTVRLTLVAQKGLPFLDTLPEELDWQELEAPKFDLEN